MSFRALPRLLLLGVLAACATGTRAPSTALRWVTDSAEYRAICTEVYRAALTQIRARAGEAARTRPLAVVLDLDETILDNSAFQRHLDVRGVDYDAHTWNDWQLAKEAEIGAVPGAVAFLDGVRALGVEAVFITNREAVLEAVTRRSLRRLGAVPADAPQPTILFRDGSSDKSARRAQVAADREVVAYIGDVVTDWPPTTSPDDDRIGTAFFCLPNPVYGFTAAR